MTSRRRIILVSVFVLAIMGMGLIAWISRNSGNSVPQYKLYRPAMEKMIQSGTLNAHLDIDTFLLVPAAGNADSASGENVTELPVRISGPVSVSYPSGSAVRMHGDMRIASSLGGDKLMNLGLVLSESGQLFARLSGLPNDLNDSMDIKQLNDTWFTVGSKALSKLLPWAVNEKDIVESGDSPHHISSSQLRAVMSGMFIPYKRYEDTTRQGHSAAHYEMAVNQDKVSALIVLLMQSVGGSMLSADQKTAIMEYVAQRRWMAEAWIDTERKNLLELKLGIFPKSGSQGMPVALSLQNFALDAPVSIPEPHDASPLSVVLMKVLRVPATSLNN